MSAEPKRLAALFFLTRPAGDKSLLTLLRLAGATNCVPVASSPEWLSCRWANFDCITYHETRGAHNILVIRFWQADFLALLPDDEAPLPLAADPTLPLALAFRDACLALMPEAACIVTHLQQAEASWIGGCEALICQRNVDALADANVGLFYLSAPLSQRLSVALAQQRDTLPIATGLLLFAGSGDPFSRWF